MRTQRKNNSKNRVASSLCAGHRKSIMDAELSAVMEAVARGEMTAEEGARRVSEWQSRQQ